jgi:hypothetical protein
MPFTATGRREALCGFHVQSSGDQAPAEDNAMYRAAKRSIVFVGSPAHPRRESGACLLPLLSAHRRPRLSTSCPIRHQHHRPAPVPVRWPQMSPARPVGGRSGPPRHSSCASRSCFHPIRARRFAQAARHSLQGAWEAVGAGMGRLHVVQASRARQKVRFGLASECGPRVNVGKHSFAQDNGSPFVSDVARRRLGHLRRAP